MRRGSAWLVFLAGVAVLLIAWVTTAGFTPVLRGADPAEPSYRHTPASGVDAGQDSGTQPRNLPDEQLHHIPAVLVVALYVVLIGFALGLGLIVWHRLILRRLQPRRARQEAVEAAVADHDVSHRLPRALAGSADRGLAALHDGAPRNAIVRCWLLLEDAVTRAGLPRDPALTSAEFTSAVLAHYAVDDGSIHALAALYREARFSTHPLDESHRQRAVDALGALRAELEAASGVGASREQVSPSEAS